MFILLNSIFLLFLSLLWARLNQPSKRLIRIFILFWLVILFSSFYLNGMDWAIYFIKFENDNELYKSFETGFILLFKFLLFFSYYHFGVAIIIFYFIAFSMLLYSLSKYKLNEPFFIAILIIMCGHTLILEQLRQFLACLIIFPSLIEYQKNNSLKKTYLLVIFASLFHISALLILPVIFLCTIKNKYFFLISTIGSILFIIILLMSSHYLLSFLESFNFIFTKISYYLEKNPIEIKFGWINILIFIFPIMYILDIKNIENHSNNKLLLRFLFIGATILIFSGTILFLNRFSFYFIFILIYMILIYNKNTKQKKSRNILVNGYFTLLVLFSFLSYFRNDVAPVKFDNLDLHFFDLFEYNYLKVNSEVILLKELNG
ncbi:EpsG family protein [Proteus mirabilis]|uniref:EpsG family protein n=1 Tax=Proteus mirabilis TaxID=584 RepID=UPI0016278F88|nr:EpsG family protein [Proteus mirabilis]MBB6663356.1 EpsG family protein [Proteus mirabilis]MBB6706780.1 EpsG family protein [Proteus mirabilis]MBB6728898.1 EpsG family protein [Proteus mirabilis]MBS3845415.1 EpsG family protein [Proteus mirabilis]